MAKAIGINDLSKTLHGILNEYSEYVSSETKAAIKKVGKEAAKELRTRSPKLTGDYAESWKSETTHESTNTIHVSVHAGNHEYGLTHLLENGHALRKGGRKVGTVPAIEHIKPVNEAAIEKVVEAIEKQL